VHLVKILFPVDSICAFAYLSLKELYRLPASIEVEFVPVLFAGLLDHYGQTGPDGLMGRSHSLS
jgi:hypothetical protein